MNETSFSLNGLFEGPDLPGQVGNAAQQALAPAMPHVGPHVVVVAPAASAPGMAAATGDAGILRRPGMAAGEGVLGAVANKPHRYIDEKTREKFQKRSASRFSGTTFLLPSHHIGCWYAA